MIIYLETLGCCRNQVDSEVMLGRLASRGHDITHDPSGAEVIIINTCGFIAAASAEAIDTILGMAQYKTEGSCRRLVVTGCLPERFRDDTLTDALPEVDAFLGTGACDRIVEAVEDKTKTVITLLPDPCTRELQGLPLPGSSPWITLHMSKYQKAVTASAPTALSHASGGYKEAAQWTLLSKNPPP